MELSILPIGAFDEEFLNIIQNYLKLFRFQTVILKEIEIPKTAFFESRNQYLSQHFLKLAEGFPGDRVLAVTNVDLFHPGLNFIFGQARYSGRVCIISTYRLKTKNLEIFVDRVLKEANHELGHTFGLRHCQNSKCVMFFSNSLWDTDNKSKDFCENCRKLLENEGVF